MVGFGVVGFIIFLIRGIWFIAFAYSFCSQSSDADLDFVEAGQDIHRVI